MSLIQMGLTNYRCFAGSLVLELRPLTLVLGRNNSGKSALVRAPLVISTGVDTDSPAPLDLDVLSEDIVDSFTDLIYGGRPHGSVGINLTFKDPSGHTLGFDALVRNIDEYRTQVVEQLILRDGDERTRFDWLPADLPLGVQRYRVRAGQADWTAAMPFMGLLPAPDPVDDPDESGFEFTTMIRHLRSWLSYAFGSVRYLGPFRDRPSRLYRVPARMPPTVGSRGELTAAVLASDSTRGQRSLLREINAGLQQSLPNWMVDVVERGGMVSVVLRSRSDDTVTVNLVDTGTGLAQALPIFVQRALDQISPPDRPVLEIVEQPELHLHPYAHAALADLYLAGIRSRQVQFLVETHSETLLLRTRVHVAEGTADPADIAIYFVENDGGASTVRPINVDADGNLDYWPEGVFSEDYREIKRLTRAQLNRLAPDAR